MHVCSNCGHEILIEPIEKVSWWKYQPRAGGVSLGCGTLIIIAIIVAAFSGNNSDPQLTQKVDALTVLVEEIHASISETP